MGSRSARWRQSWAPQPLTPLMEGPDPEMQEEGTKKESSWEVIREWFKAQKISPGGAGNNNINSFYGTIHAKTQDLRLLLGVLGCPLAPIPSAHDPTLPIHNHIKDTPFVSPPPLSLYPSKCCTTRREKIRNPSLILLLNFVTPELITTFIFSISNFGRKFKFSSSVAFFFS